MNLKIQLKISNELEFNKANGEREKNQRTIQIQFYDMLHYCWLFVLSSLFMWIRIFTYNDVGIGRILIKLLDSVTVLIEMTWITMFEIELLITEVLEVTSNLLYGSIKTASKLCKMAKLLIVHNWIIGQIELVLVHRIYSQSRKNRIQYMSYYLLLL